MEAVDRTLQDLTENKLNMGGITILFLEDWLENYTSDCKRTQADEVTACL